MLKNCISHPIFNVGSILQELALGGEVGEHDFRLTYQFLKNYKQEVFTLNITR